MITIVDLDNCIAADRWRIHLIRRDEPDLVLRYKVYHEESIWDAPANLAMVAGRSVVISTTRPEAFRDVTARWLLGAQRALEERVGAKSTGNELSGAPIYMRPDDDHRPTPELKALFAQQIERNHGRIVEAWDDRDDVLDAYRALGLRTRKVVARTLTEEEHDATHGR